MPRSWRVGAFSLLSVALLLFTISLGCPAHSQTHPLSVRTTPFIAEISVLHTATDKQNAVVGEERYSRRSDGSYSRMFEVKSPAGESGWAGEILDVRRGYYVVLEPFTKSAVVFFRSELETQKEINTVATCAGDDSTRREVNNPKAKRDTLLGRHAIRVVDRHEGITVERWVDASLGCYDLRRSEWSPTGAHNEFKVTKVEEGEPPDAVFAIPQGYVETSPLELESAYATKYPGHPFWGTKAAQVMQDRYIKSRGTKK